MVGNYPWQKNDIEYLHGLGKRSVHALLLKGRRGTGKLDLAFNFSKGLLCQHPDKHGLGCGKCASCHWFEQDSHPDFRFLQPESLAKSTGIENDSGKKSSKQITVDQVRVVSEFMGMTAHQGGRRIIVIYPAESMNTNASNALLKSLEEPPEGLLFILVTHQPQRLLPTILSRCVSISLTTPTNHDATSWLRNQGIENPEEVLALSGFSPIDALNQEKMLGGAERQKLLSALCKPESLDVISIAEILQKTEQPIVVRWLQQWCFDLNSMKLTGTLRYHHNQEKIINSLINSVSSINLAQLQQYLQRARRDSEHTLNTKLFFESLLLKYRQLMLEKS